MTRTLGRLLKLLALLLRYALFPAIVFWRRKQVSWPVQIRKILEEMGGTWVKLGQVLALRFDLLPPEYCYELFKLLNSIRPFPYAQVRKIIAEDLGDEPEKIFRSFEKESFASASIGQVHRAVLPSGQKVAVKVQRPDIHLIIQVDLRLMYLVTGLIDFSGLMGATRSRKIIDEFARWTADELDYRIEARHARHLYQNARGDPLEKNAKVYLRYSSERVLTTQFVDGIPLIDILYAIGRKDEAYMRDLQARGYDRLKIATHIAWNLLNQVYAQGYFHADLHPANLFVLPNNAIGYVDFGITGTLPSDVRESLMTYARNLFRGDLDSAVSEFMRWVAPSEDTDIQAARTAMIRALDEYLTVLRSQDEDEEGPRRKTPQAGHAALQINLINTIRQYRMSVSPYIVAYMKAVITADAVIHEVWPNFDLQTLENRFFGKMLLDLSRGWTDPRKLAAELLEFRLLANRVSTAVIETASSGRSAFSTFDRVVARLRLFGLIALAAGGGLLFIMNDPGLRARFEDWKPVPILVALLALSLLGVFHQSRRLPSAEGNQAASAQAQLRGRSRPDL